MVVVITPKIIKIKNLSIQSNYINRVEYMSLETKFLSFTSQIFYNYGNFNPFKDLGSNYYY